MEHPENSEEYKGLTVNSGIVHPDSINPYFKKRPIKRPQLSVQDYVDGIIKGNVTVLSQAVTLVESLKPEHQAIAQEVIEKCLPYSGNSVRIGISGVPGAGKSTSIDEFGLHVLKEVERGKVAVSLEVSKASGVYHLDFSVNGTVIVTCDRCLDDMSLDIENIGSLKVKLGPDFADDGDIIVVPEDKGIVNVAWYIYEFIALAIPIKHVHAPGKCNKGMMEKLDEHIAQEGSEDGSAENVATDPRWDDLKNIIENDNE